MSSHSVFNFYVILAIVCVIVMIISRQKMKICTQCGVQGCPKIQKKGSIFIGILLLTFGIVPGLIYAIWMQTTRERVCRVCGSQNIVPLTSPVGRRLRAEFADRS